MIEQKGSEASLDDLLKMTTDIVSAYVGKNVLSTHHIPDLINAVHASLVGLRSGAGIASSEALTPAVPIKKSVTPDYIICLEDGKKLKMLKRHLRSTYAMTPEDYRAKWGLPADYPMVAPNYAAQRSEFAKKIGLGRDATRTGRRRMV
jgi:predicted transcriptional regulator